VEPLGDSLAGDDLADVGVGLLLARNAHAFADLDADAWVACFTSDGVWEVWEGSEAAPSMRVEGRDALRDWVKPYFAERRSASLLGRHVQDALLVVERGDEMARLRVQFHTLLGHQGRWSINRAGWFDDEILRSLSGEWLFARRSMRCDG
jgi:hypothetical protein